MKEFNSGYKELLLEQYPAEVVGQITSEPMVALSGLQDSTEVPYVYAASTRNPDADPSIFIVPGFGESIVNKASFVAELAVQGANVAIPGQNREEIMRNPAGDKDAAYTQAQNYLAAMRRSMRSGEITSVVSHSYGSLVLSAMIEAEPEMFKDIDVVMLAPAGIVDRETYPRMFRRWLGMIKSESDKNRPMEFPDPRGVTATASVKELAKNPLRTLLEIRDLRRKRVDFTKLVKMVGSLTVLTYAEDAMYPENKMEKTMRQAIELGVIWATPIDPKRALDGQLSYPGESATHDDEQFNPSRVTGSLLQIIG